MKTEVKLRKLENMARVHASAIDIISKVSFPGGMASQVKEILDDMNQRADSLKRKIMALRPPAAPGQEAKCLASPQVIPGSHG